MFESFVEAQAIYLVFSQLNFDYLCSDLLILKEGQSFLSLSEVFRYFFVFLEIIFQLRMAIESFERRKSELFALALRNRDEQEFQRY